MKTRIVYQGISGTRWMDEYMEGKLARLERYLSPEADVFVLLSENKTQLTIHHHKHEYEFNDEGADLFEAFSVVLEEALKLLRVEHQRIINKIHHRSLSLE